MKPLKIYIAAPWVCGGTANEIAHNLRQEGFHITSSWLKRATENLSDSYDYNKDPSFTRQSAAYQAKRDIKDIKKADVVVVYNLEKSEGKVVEQGIALALGKPIIVLGPRTNIFQNLKQVHVCLNYSQVIHFLEGLLKQWIKRKKKKNT